MARRRVRPKEKASPPTYEVAPHWALGEPFGTDEVRTIVGRVAARYSNWETIRCDLEIASKSLDEFLPVRAEWLNAPESRPRSASEDQVRRLTQLWTTAVTFFYRCYNANGKRRHFLVAGDFPEFQHHRVIDAVKHHRDKAIHHSVSAADASVVGMSFREGRPVAVVSALNRRFFPDPRWPHAECFKEVVERGLAVAKTRLYWAEDDLQEYARSQSDEQRAALPEGLKLPDPSFGLGELPRPDDGSTPSPMTQPKSGLLNPIRTFAVQRFRLCAVSTGLALHADPATETVLVRSRSGSEEELTCKVGVFARVEAALKSAPSVSVQCATEKSPGGLESRTRVIALADGT